jgi:hypothetical protein
MDEPGFFFDVVVHPDDRDRGWAAHLGAAGATIVDASNQFIIPGIIDCHSHIAGEGGINEGTVSVSSMVNIKDIIDPEQIAIKFHGFSTFRRVVFRASGPGVLPGARRRRAHEGAATSFGGHWHPCVKSSRPSRSTCGAAPADHKGSHPCVRSKLLNTSRIALPHSATCKAERQPRKTAGSERLSSARDEGVPVYSFETPIWGYAAMGIRPS